MVQDTSGLQQSPQGNLYVEPLANVLAVASSVLEKSCEDCDFLNIQLVGPSSQVNFEGWNLTGANFSGADLNNINFSNATLTGAKFPGATVSAARLLNVSATPGSIHLAGASVFKDVFTGSTFNSFNFAGARICGVSLSGTDANPPQRTLL